MFHNSNKSKLLTLIKFMFNSSTYYLGLLALELTAALHFSMRPSSLQFSYVISYLIQYLFCLESVYKMNYYFSFAKITKEMSRQRRLYLFQSGNGAFLSFLKSLKKSFNQLCLKSVNRCRVRYMCLQVYLLILSAI